MFLFVTRVPDHQIFLPYDLNSPEVESLHIANLFGLILYHRTMATNATSDPLAQPQDTTTEVPLSDLQMKFFNFAPSAFFSTIFTAVDEYVADGIDAMEVRYW